MAMVSKKATILDVILVIIITFCSAIFLYPMIVTLATSLSDSKVLLSRTVYFIPYGFTLDSYHLVLNGTHIFRYYYNTISYALIGTLNMLACTSMMAYPLTFHDFRGKRLVSIILLITMFFGGGLVPSYLNIMKMGLLDTFAVMVIPGAISAYNVFLFRTFFKSIPDSLRESAYIDGAGHFRVLLLIILPLSKALLATFSLFSIVGYWNDYLTAVIYLKSTDKQPIQMFLRKLLILVEISNSIDNYDLMRTLRTISTRTIQSAAIIVTVVPVLCVYPFLQKYFVKGIFVGSIKG